MSEALRVFSGRPVTLPDPQNPGWVDHIAIHDAEHLRMRAEWRQRLAKVHPDAGGTDLSFHRVKRQHEAWLREETAWYARRGLTLPDAHHRPSDDRVTRLLSALPETRGGRQIKVREQISALLAESPTLTVREIATAIGKSPTVTRAILKRMQADAARGPRASVSHRLLRLLVDGRPHTAAECRAVIGVRQVSNVVSRLRAKGFDIVTRPSPLTCSYQLLGVGGGPL